MLNFRARFGLSLPAAALLFVAAAITPSAVQAQNAAGAEIEELAAIRSAAGDGADKRPSPFNFVRAFDTSLTTSSQHDSSGGWSSIFYPALAWRPNRHVAIDATVPAYIFLGTYADIGTTAEPHYVYQPQRGAWGDAVVNIEADVPMRSSFAYSGIFSLGLPSGNAGFGIGAGQVTFSINNWFQRDIGRFTPNIALGYGDTSSLVNQGVLRNYVAVGPMAHFQAGSSVALTRIITFNAAAYEELPLATDLVYTTTGKGKKQVTTSVNKDPGEDNGFLTSLSIPFSPRFSMTGFYSRSLRDHTDIAGFSFTLTARAARAQ